MHDSANSMKQCPDCGKLVQRQARVCRFCRVRFDTKVGAEDHIGWWTDTETISDFALWRPWLFGVVAAFVGIILAMVCATILGFTLIIVTGPRVIDLGGVEILFAGWLVFGAIIAWLAAKWKQAEKAGRE